MKFGIVVAEDYTILSFEGESLSQLKSGVIDVTNIGMYIYLYYLKKYMLLKTATFTKFLQNFVHSFRKEWRRSRTKPMFILVTGLIKNSLNYQKKKAKQK